MSKIECWAVSYEYNMAAFLLPEKGWVPKIVFFGEESKAKSFSETARSDYYRSIFEPIRMVPSNEMLDPVEVGRVVGKLTQERDELREAIERITEIGREMSGRSIIDGLKYVAEFGWEKPKDKHYAQVLLGSFDESPARGEEERG